MYLQLPCLFGVGSLWTILFCLPFSQLFPFFWYICSSSALADLFSYSFISFVYSLVRLELVTVLIIVLLCKLNFQMSRHFLITIAPKSGQQALALIFSSIKFALILVCVPPPNTKRRRSYGCLLNLIFHLYMDILSGSWQKVIQISCGWRHTLAVTERQNVFSWGRGTNGQLGHGVYVDR